jgi:lipoic acid synthetase
MRCFSEGTATFMILGNVCTRNCTFCAVQHGKPEDADPHEAAHIVEAVSKLKLRYAVITSVTRDDLPDGGASQFAYVIDALKKHIPNVLVEVLIPDFLGSAESLRQVIDAAPVVLNHNIETVPRLYPEVRPQARYERSLALLRQAKRVDGGQLTKSGIMLGLGETGQEIVSTLSDIRETGCDFITISQYLQPSLRHHPLVRYVTPEEFEEYGSLAKEMGFSSVSSGPLVRSSFHAADDYLRLKRVVENHI